MSEAKQSLLLLATATWGKPHLVLGIYPPLNLPRHQVPSLYLWRPVLNITYSLKSATTKSASFLNPNKILYFWTSPSVSIPRLFMWSLMGPIFYLVKILYIISLSNALGFTQILSTSDISWFLAISLCLPNFLFKCFLTLFIFLTGFP